MKRRFSTHLAQALGLMALGCALVIVAPANRVSIVQSPVTSPTSSPTPTPKRDEERPNPMRRFFSWVKDGVTRPFRRKQSSGIYDHFITVALSSSSSSITFCPTWSSSNNCPSSREVKLSASASVPEPQELAFAWMVTGGRLRGEGREVTWDLSNLPEGTYTATVEVNNGNYQTATDSIKVTISLCPICDRPPPLCPTVSVSCPSAVESKQEITFVANVSGGEPDMKPTYTWSVTAGKIIRGQGTSKITIDASEVGRQSITATVSLGGVHPACSGYTASCTLIDAIQ